MKRFQQKEGIDYIKTFVFIVKPISYKIIFAIIATKNWKVYQMDIKTAFLYKLIEREIYVQ